MGSGFHSVATRGHAAPAPPMRLGQVVEKQCAVMRLAFPYKLQIFIREQVHERLCNRFKQAGCTHALTALDDPECAAGFVPLEFVCRAARFQYLVDDGGIGRASCFSGEDHRFGIASERESELQQTGGCTVAAVGQ